MDYFLCVGAQKAGTTWLHRQLVRHPEVHVPEWKELHFFDMARPPSGPHFADFMIEGARRALTAGRTEAVHRRLEVLQLPFADRTGTAYRNYLLRDAPDSARVVGELTPSYSTLEEEGFRFAYEVLEAPRIIFLMRDPLERLWSSIRMRISDNPESHFATPIKGPVNWRRSDYEGTIRRLEAVFPPELIHYAFYEDLFTPDALGGIASFLGVTPEWPWDLDERVRAGREAPLPEPAPALLDQLLPVYEFVHHRFGDRVPASWRH